MSTLEGDRLEARTGGCPHRGPEGIRPALRPVTATASGPGASGASEAGRGWNGGWLQLVFGPTLPKTPRAHLTPAVPVPIPVGAR